MAKIEKTIKENTVYNGKILRLNCDDVLASNGDIVKREIIHHHGGVCVLAEVDGKIVFVKQFRYSYKEMVLELPAGKLEKGEDSYAAGIRELEEEAGLHADKLIDFGEMYPSCGYTNEIIHLYKAEGLHPVERHLDSDESIDICYYTLDEAVEMIKNNKIKDAKTICLVLKYANSKQ